MESDLISIIVPVYNVEKYIERCITSILRQTYKNIEIILVDDGSTDNSGVICDKYSNNQIKVIHKPNEGLGFARNSGLDIAKGKYITFVDSDDYIGPNFIEEMYDLIIKTNTDTCLSGYIKVSSKHMEKYVNNLAGKVFYDNIKEEILPKMCGADNSGKNNIEMSVCMAMLSNEIIKKNKLRFKSEKEMISEDLAFDFEYYPLSHGLCISKSTEYFYCNHEGSLTTKYRSDRFEKQVILYNTLKSMSENLDIKDLCIPRLNNTLISIARYSIKLEYKFIKNLGKKRVRQNVKKICNNEILINALKNYKDDGLKKTSRIVNKMIKYRRYFLLEITMILKNKLNI